MININNLHIKSDPKLIFTANDVKNKGRSHKSYTINIVNDPYNDSQLSQVFSSKARRSVMFDAVYTIESIQLNGLLLISSIDEISGSGVFVSGNGKLWDSLDNSNLRDYDWSEFDHVLNYTNVIGTESGGDYIYDLCDRGEFINEAETVEKIPGVVEVAYLASVDITERYPAVKIKTIIETILNQEGYGVTFTDKVFNVEIDKQYLLYTQDNAIRNSKEWEKSAIFDAYGTASHTDSGISTDTGFTITRKLWFQDEKIDNGGNFTSAANDDLTSNIYTVPETGTYRFIVPLFLQMVKPSTATISDHYLQVSLKRNSTTVFYRTYTAAELAFSNNVATVELEIDTLPTEFNEDDEIAIYVTFAGVVTSIRDWVVYLNQQSGTRFYNTVSRYYGAGSTVSLATLMPDMKALDFIAKVSKYLNLYSFYREEKRLLEMNEGRREEQIIETVDPVLVTEEVNELANFTLEFNTDKAEPPDDIYFDNSGTKEDTIKFDFSRTLISDCIRVFGNVSTQIPVMWQDGNPSTWLEVLEPPKWKTKGNIRVCEFDYLPAADDDVTADSTEVTGDAGSGYTLTYGGSNSANSVVMKNYPIITEPDIEEMHRYDLQLEGDYLKCTAKLKLDKLYDQSYFKQPLWIEGYGRFWLVSAELIKGDIYKLELQK